VAAGKSELPKGKGKATKAKDEAPKGKGKAPKPKDEAPKGKGKGKGKGKDKGAGRGQRRKELRQLCAAERGEMLARRLIGFDFDCTLTIRHFYKAFAWGYFQGSAQAHPHCQEFFEYCRKNGMDSKMKGIPDHEDCMVCAVEDFCRHAGEDAFREVFRTVFLGGEERISLVADWLRRMQESRVDFDIVTAGTSSTVLRALAVTPEWLPFFPSNRVWDCSQGRHAVRSVAAQKALILRDICPTAGKILLVDDALSHDKPPEWVLQAANVKVFRDLPYEGPGVDAEILEAVEAALLE